jgi:hypothetical protein
MMPLSGRDNPDATPTEEPETMTTYSLKDIPTATLTSRALDNARALDRPGLSAAVARSLIRQRRELRSELARRMG